MPGLTQTRQERDHYAIKLRPLGRSHGRMSGFDVREYVEKNKKIRVSVANKNTKKMSSVKIRRDMEVLLWSDDLRGTDSGELLGIGRVVSNPKVAAKPYVVPDIDGTIVEAGEYYVDVEVTECFEKGVTTGHLRRLGIQFQNDPEFAAFVATWKSDRVSRSRPMDEGVFELIRNVAARDQNDTAPGNPVFGVPSNGQNETAATDQDTLLEEFRRHTKGLPRNTEVERIHIERIGQPLFKIALVKFWNGRCAITGLAIPEILRGSHAKPWAKCEGDAERLCVHNGLLLAAHVDAAFDAGLISIADNGELLISRRLDPASLRLLGLTPGYRIQRLIPAHLPWLEWHRNNLFSLN